MKLNEKIKATRIKSSLTQKQLAEKVYVSMNTIARFEQGRNGIGYYVLERICGILELELQCK